MFISLSSRAKFLTSKQTSLKYSLGHNEMFHRKFFSGNRDKLFEKVLNYLNEIQIEEDLFSGEDELANFYTSSGHHIPMNTVSCYININPSSTVKAYQNLTEKMNKTLYELINSNSEQKYSEFLKLQSNLNTEVQKARSRRVWIDIDFDVDSIQGVEYFISQLPEDKNRVFIIQTHSGYHVLLKQDFLKEFTPNLGKIVKETLMKFENKEIIFNSNGMVPLPGTYQGGVEVKLINY